MRLSLLRDMLRNRSAALGLALLAFVALAAAFGPLLSPYDPAKMSFLTVLKPPSLAHPFGTDSYGRDVLTRVLHGARVSLLASLVGVGIGAVIGTALGLAAAFIGKLYDTVLMRVVDLLFAFPNFVMALMLMFVFGAGLVNVIVAIALAYLPGFARLARNMAMVARNETYVEAAWLMGQSRLRIMAREILPNIAAPLVVQASAAVAFGVIIESGLSFLGLGIQPPTATLGGIMADGKDYFARAPWVLTCTGLTISLALLGLNLLGDGIRDLMDPRLRREAGL